MTIPEGLTSEQIIERLKADDSLVGEMRPYRRGFAAAGNLYYRSVDASRQSIVDKMQGGPQTL